MAEPAFLAEAARLPEEPAPLVAGVEVRHLLHDGRLAAHAVTDPARREGDHVVYRAGATPPLPL